MGMPGRKYTAGSGYRYGFNGKEKSDEITSDDYDYGARIYDGRLGRWLSLDPLQKKYPGESHYAFVSNSPILYKDVDGRDKIVTITILNKDGSKAVLKTIDKNYFNYHTVKGTFATAYQDRTHKESISINYTIDNRGEKSSLVNYSVQAYDINDNYTLVEQAGDWVKDLFKDGPRKYGLTMTGGGAGISPQAQLEWDSNLPKAEYSDFIGSISGLLDAASNWREFAPLTKDGDEFKHEIFQFIANENFKKVVESLDNIGDAIGAIKSAAEIAPSASVTTNEVQQCESCKSFKQGGKEIDTTGKGIKPSEIKQVPLTKFHE